MKKVGLQDRNKTNQEASKTHQIISGSIKLIFQVIKPTPPLKFLGQLLRNLVMFFDLQVGMHFQEHTVLFLKKFYERFACMN